MRGFWWAVLALVIVSGCRQPPPARQYELTGQILAIKPDRNEVILKHNDIPGFMPAMTMTYKVKEPELLNGRKEGDMVKATLVVEEVKAYLSSLNVTGHQPLDTAAPVTDTAHILTPGEPVADALLVDQGGKPMPFSSLRGHRVALTFVYTRCPLPDYCVLMEKNFAAVQQALAAKPELSDVRLLTVTMDPEFDTPAVLKPHAIDLGANPAVWTFATGDPKEVQRFGEQFGIHVERDPTNKWQLIHNLRTAVIGADGKVVKTESGNFWTPPELVADLEKTPAPAR
ncbi:MAG TPA: SCO family protein [Vicinamibacterales bacterium]|nr:SCO family protein [Vicinamibacterales bacterium]